MREIQTVCEGLQFPEGPVAMSDGSIAVVEMARGTVSKVHHDGSIAVVAELGGGPNGLAAGPDNALYVCNNGGYAYTRQDGKLRTNGIAPDYQGGMIQRIDLVTGRASTLYTHCSGNRLSSPNDITFARDGGFYFSDIGKIRPRTRDRGGIYYGLPDGSEIVECVYPMLTPNGLALSPDGTAIYVCDTENSYVWLFEIQGSGRLKKERFPFFEAGRLAAAVPAVKAFDGMALDVKGNIYLACIATGQIIVLDSTGRLIEEIDFPDRHTTNICFGGPRNTTAFVTQSHTGRLLRVELDHPGLDLAFVV